MHDHNTGATPHRLVVSSTGQPSAPPPAPPLQIGALKAQQAGASVKVTAPASSSRLIAAAIADAAPVPVQAPPTAAAISGVTGSSASTSVPSTSVTPAVTAVDAPAAAGGDSTAPYLTLKSSVSSLDGSVDPVSQSRVPSTPSSTTTAPPPVPPSPALLAAAALASSGLLGDDDISDLDPLTAIGRARMISELADIVPPPATSSSRSNSKASVTGIATQPTGAQKPMGQAAASSTSSTAPVPGKLGPRPPAPASQQPAAPTVPVPPVPVAAAAPARYAVQIKLPSGGEAVVYVSGMVVDDDDDVIWSAVSTRLLYLLDRCCPCSMSVVNGSSSSD